jgi:hypothetical protein
VEYRKWPSRRPPPPGWVVSPDLTELYGYNVIVRQRSMSKIRRAVRDSRKDNHLKREGKRQMVAGGILAALGLASMYKRR